MDIMGYISGVGSEIADLGPKVVGHLHRLVTDVGVNVMVVFLAFQGTSKSGITWNYVRLPHLDTCSVKCSLVK